MKELSKWQNMVFLSGGMLMVAGAGLAVLQWEIASYLYAVGALCFASMQMQQRYDGANLTILRLRRIMLFSDVLFLITAVLMFASKQNLFGISQIVYVQYIYNKWVVTLVLAALIQLYSVHRIDYELRQEAKKR